MRKLVAVFSLALILTVVVMAASIYDEMRKAASETATSVRAQYPDCTFCCSEVWGTSMKGICM